MEKNNADDNEDQQGLEMHKHSMELNICESILNINKKNHYHPYNCNRKCESFSDPSVQAESEGFPEEFAALLHGRGSWLSICRRNDSFLHSRVAVFRRQVCRQGLTLFSCAAAKAALEICTSCPFELQSTDVSAVPRLCKASLLPASPRNSQLRARRDCNAAASFLPGSTAGGLLQRCAASHAEARR